MRKLGLFIIIFSIVILLLTCVCWGFYDQIAETGFYPLPILFVITLLSVMAAIAGGMMCCGIFDDI